MHARRKEWTVADALELISSAELSPAEVKELVQIAHSITERELDRRVRQVKASRDGASLPEVMILRDLMGPAEYRLPCRCEVMFRQKD
jgi:hypothetical protein